MGKNIRIPSGTGKRTSTPPPSPPVRHDGNVKGCPAPNKRATSSGGANPPPKK